MQVLMVEIVSVMFRYKERLKTKYLKQRKKTDTSPSLIGRNWILVRRGMDDFRSGVPLDFKGEYVVEVSSDCFSLTNF